MKDFLIGLSYTLVGFKYLLYPKIRKFVIWPLLINLVIFALAFYWGYDTIVTKVDSYQVSELPSWLTWLESFMGWLLAGIKWLLTTVWIIIFIFAFSFVGTIVANLVASPFNGLLCESMDLNVNQFTPPERSLTKVIIASILRELRKWVYYLPRLILVGLICLVLFFIPIANVFSTALLYIFGCWMLAFQYLDYPADNRVENVLTLKKKLKSKKLITYGFGLGVYIFTLIPIVNFIILPLATLSATKLWADHYQSIKLEN